MENIKLSLLISAAVFSGTLMYGQAKEASVMIDKENRNAVMITIDQPENITSDALQQRLERSGLKSKSRNGVMSFKGVVLSEISPGKVDMYTKVEKGPNNSSVVYMAVSRGYNNFTNSAADSSIAQNVSTFLESLVMDANNQYADVGITTQMNEINKDEKDYQNLLEEQKDLQKEKADIDNKLTDVQNRINRRSDSLSRKKTGLEEARVKRGNMLNLKK